jgi:AraC-like DNA-binding protein
MRRHTFPCAEHILNCRRGAPWIKLSTLADNLVMALKPDSLAGSEPAGQPPNNPQGAVGAVTDQAGSEAFYRIFPASERDHEWGFYATVIGAWRIAPHAPYPAKVLPRIYHYVPPQTRVLHEYQVCYISRGGGWLETGTSGRHRIEAGSIYFLFPGVRHCEMPDPESGWDEQFICFDGEVARRVMGRRFFSPKRPVIQVRCQETLLELFTEAVSVSKANQPALQQILAGISLYVLGQIYSDQSSKKAGYDHSAGPMHSAITAMREAFTSDLDLHKLARDLGSSYSSFRHQFAHHTGMSPHQYLLSLRLARARNLLTNTTLSGKQIAHESGFQDEQYFCRLFRKKTGATPTEWRLRSTRSLRPKAVSPRKP